MEEKLSVLVVDDDREIVESIAIYLSRENLTIYKAYDGLQALDIVAAHTIHLILMDIMMPKMDGIKAMLKLRERNNIPVSYTHLDVYKRQSLPCPQRQGLKSKRRCSNGTAYSKLRNSHGAQHEER